MAGWIVSGFLLWLFVKTELPSMIDWIIRGGLMGDLWSGLSRITGPF